MNFGTPRDVPDKVRGIGKMATQATACPHLDFNHRSREVAHNREVISQQLLATPIFYTDAFDGYYVVTTYELCKSVLSSADIFSSAKKPDGSGGVTIPPLNARLLPGEADPPLHTAVRRAMNPLFSPQGMQKVQPIVDAVVARTIDQVIEKGTFDVVHDFAEPIPAGVVLTYLGFDFDKPEMLAVAGKAAQSMMGTALDPDEAATNFSRMTDALRDLVARRKAAPADDATSFLIQQDSYRFTDDELYWAVFTVAVGGIETPTALLENSLLYIDQHPTLKQRLIADPSLIPAAFEEFLRFFTPGGALARTVTQDVELAGVQLKPGDRVLVWLPSANKDGQVFPDPELVDIDRPGLRNHLALGQGRHFCLGAPLARLELITAIQEVLRRIPDYRIDMANARRFDDVGNMYGWWKMPAATNL